MTRAAGLIKLSVILCATGFFDSAATTLESRSDLFRAGDERLAKLQQLVRDWSKVRATAMAAEQLRLAFRGLVPLLRSRLGGIPAPEPAVPA